MHNKIEQNNKQNEEFLTKEKDKFQMGWYDKKGYLNRQLVKSVMFFGFLFGFTLINYISMTTIYFISYQVDYEIFFGLEKQIEYMINLSQIYWDTVLNIKNGYFDFTNNWKFVLINILAVGIPIYLLVKLFLSIKERAKIQSFLASNSLNQYYLYSVDYKENSYVFKLIKGESINFEAFNKKNEDLCQFFNLSTMEAKRKGEDKVIVTFNKTFPTINDEDVKALNKSIDKYKKKGYMTLGYSNISDKNVVEEKVGNLFIKYLSLDELTIHIKAIGLSGFGKSVLFAQLLKNFLNSFGEIDTLFIHDFKGIENERMDRYIKQSSQKEDLEKRIFTSTKMEELEDILVKLKIVYEYRKVIMNDNNWTNYNGNKIILMIDEYNIGMSVLESKNKFERKKGEITERMIKDLALLYRAMNIFIIVVGQSNQVQDNWNSTLNKQTSIGFCLRSSNYVASAFCNEAYEKGINPANFNKGEVLFFNANNSIYFKYLSAYLDENFLFDMGELNIVERKGIDNKMFKKAKQLKSKLLKENKIFYDKLLKEDEIKETDYTKYLDDFNESLSKNIEEITDYKFLVKENDSFNFIDDDEFAEKESLLKEKYDDEPLTLEVDKKEEKEVERMQIRANIQELRSIFKEKERKESINQVGRIDLKKVEKDEMIDLLDEL